MYCEALSITIQARVGRWLNTIFLGPVNSSRRFRIQRWSAEASTDRTFPSALTSKCVVRSGMGKGEDITALGWVFAVVR